MRRYFYLGHGRVAVLAARRWLEYLWGAEVGADVTDMVHRIDQARKPNKLQRYI
jgi:hypothetical protein